MGKGNMSDSAVKVTDFIKLLWKILEDVIGTSEKQMRLSPANISLLKVNNRNTKTRCEICSKLAIKTPERLHWGRSAIFIANFEQPSDLFLVFLLLTLNR